jgi:hypothetical protein
LPKRAALHCPQSDLSSPPQEPQKPQRRGPVLFQSMTTGEVHRRTETPLHYSCLEKSWLLHRCFSECFPLRPKHGTQAETTMVGGQNG